MFVCRARKVWPTYFTLSLSDRLEIEGQQEISSDANPIPVSLSCLINEKTLFDEESLSNLEENDSEESIDENEAVLFINPNEYTLDCPGIELNSLNQDSMESEDG